MTELNRGAQAMHNNIDMLDAAQRTGIKGGRTALFALLKKHRLFNQDNTPTRSLIDQGLFRTQFKQAHTRAGIARNYSKAVVTPKGLAWLHDFVQKNGELKPEVKTDQALAS